MRFKRSSLVTKLLILALAVYAIVTLVSLQNQVEEKNAEAAALESSIAAAQQENQRLQQAIDELGTDESVEEVARRKLGLVAEGEIVFYDVGN